MLLSPIQRSTDIIPCSHFAAMFSFPATFRLFSSRILQPYRLYKRGCRHAGSLFWQRSRGPRGRIWRAREDGRDAAAHRRRRSPASLPRRIATRRYRRSGERPWERREPRLNDAAKPTRVMPDCLRRPVIQDTRVAQALVPPRARGSIPMIDTPPGRAVLVPFTFKDCTAMDFDRYKRR